MNPVAEDILMHYGVKRRSGRYPWGSGEDPYQHSGDFLSRVEKLQKDGLSEKEVADAVGLTTTDLRMQIRVAKHQRRELEVARAKSLREDGLSLNEIAEKMGYKNDSSIRSLLNENTAANKNRAKMTAEKLKEELEEKGYLDVGVGVERELGCSAGTLKEALFILETEGYAHFGVGMSQVNNPGKQTTLDIIAKNPDGRDVKELQSEVYRDFDLVKSVGNYHSNDGGLSFTKLERPSSMSSDRVYVRYDEEGGTLKDGVIEIRRGVADLDLGNSHYAQVRIMVDGTHYLKGMAMYSDDIPDGADIVFNTNKKSTVAKHDVFKKCEADPDNPFGASIKANGQYFYDDPKGKYTDAITGKKQSLSPINKLKDEGDWDEMSKNLSSQFLSKQPNQLIKKQLNLTYADSLAEFDEIRSLTNPTVKKKLLLDFAEECDSAAVHLKAAAMPRQTTQVILPMPKLKETEVYAPNYKDGERVVLIRYPHGGTFEIPELTVNNKSKYARSILDPTVKDAIGINPKVAEQLSGADFDGDQVVVIPVNSKVKIKTQKPLDGLIDFDPKTAYATTKKVVDGKEVYVNASGNTIKVMPKSMKGKEMGMVSNLITDMTLKGADLKEIERAVKHSMVVIDAEKHKLDYKQSERDQGIAELKKKYQGYVDADGKEVGGASTLLSRRKQDVHIPERQGSGLIDPETGKVSYKTSGRTYIDKKTGKVVEAMTKSSLLLETEDLHTLSSGTIPENLYADYGNSMKALANQARKEYKTTSRIETSKAAKETYATEVARLEAALDIAARNAPKERRAQAIANSRIKAQMQDNPDLDKKELRKIGARELNNARAEIGASGKESRIHISDKEWEAIQAGAISDNKLSQILRYADDDRVRQLATPKATTQFSSAKVNKIKQMQNSGYTLAEIAASMGCSTSTVSKYLNS